MTIRLLGPLGALVVLVAACSAGGASTAPSAGPASAAPASAAAMQIMGMGDLQPIDGTASGVAEIAVLPDGTYEVILDGFMIESIDHTNVVLVENETVGATADIDKSMLLDLGPLKATEGMQSYMIPPDMASGVMDGYHSVVIWDTEMAHAIAAAALR
jgi:Electron transfer DM13